MRYALPLFLTLAACFGLQTLALRASGGRFAKNESNFFSSIGRIQAGTVGKPEVMLLGSSITGRLPDRANGFEGFANMGCDGGSAVDALRAMDVGTLSVAPVLVIEANTLFRALSAGPSEVGQAMKQSHFALGMKVPSLSAYARPAGFFYSMLLARRAGDYGDPTSDEDLRISSLPGLLAKDPSAKISAEEACLKEELLAITRRLEKRGSRILFVWLPPARAENGIPEWIRQLVVESGSLWWDLGNESDPDLVDLTDAVHMSAPSASRTVISLRKGLPVLVSTSGG
jgi:hypothetical protein